MTEEQKASLRWRVRKQNAIAHFAKLYVKYKFPRVFRRFEEQAARLVESEKRIQHQAHASE